MNPKRSTHQSLWGQRILPCVALLALGGILITFFWPPSSTPSDPPEVQQTSTTQPFGSEQQNAVIPVKGDDTWENIDNPSADGWKSEARSEAAHHQLKQIGKYLVGEVTSPSEVVDQICSADYVGTTLIPPTRHRDYDNQMISVDRWKSATNAPLEKSYQSRAGLEESLQAVANEWAQHTEKRSAFKIIRVIEDGDELETHQYIALSGQGNGQYREQHATWVARWHVTPDQQLQLSGLELTKFEETTSQGSLLFSDCTKAVLGQNPSYQEQFLFGLNHWLDRNQDMRYFSPLGNPGITLGDVNGDGLDDLYVCQETQLPNRLFVQQPDGTARDESADWQVDWLESSRSALFLDLDNDGDQDLVVAILGGLVIASNEGSRFQIRDVLTSDDDTTTLTAADYDLDGDLDLYVCVDYPNDAMGKSRKDAVQVGAARRVYHDANTAGKNSLFRNDHSQQPWTFVDVTEEVGLDVNNRRFTWAAGWEDIDKDGDPDLYVANDFGRNNLYLNENGKFQDIAAQANAEDSASGMSIAWGDYDRDGHMDAYVANMFSSAGSRISHQPEFKPTATEEVRERLQRFARGSTLLRNAGDLGFEDVSIETGVTIGRWAWSSNFVDLNNDGWQDLAVANGYITSTDTGDL